jgi:hypothetical protein
METLCSFAFLMREGDGPTECAFDEHRLGLFPRATWLDLMTEVGFEATFVPDPYVEIDPEVVRELFVGTRPV